MVDKVPKRYDIEKIMIIGSGPIVIGQACEFDYSGSQACKALNEEGYKVVLVNSNPATIMTDPDMADKTYVEPLTPDFVEKIIAKERPDALLPTLGGQVGLNIAFHLSRIGVLDKYDVQLIGANAKAIDKAENRERFKEAMEKIDVPCLEGKSISTVEEGVKFAEEIGYPVIVRPAYTLGGSGGGVAHNEKELRNITKRGLRLSMINQVLVEESVVGWKEYEFEVMRDLADNVVIICTMENLDPMGIHTGDSIVCAPAQTLNDKEYQQLRDYSIDIIREIGVDTGGSNIQFAVNPKDGEVRVVEMNPRVSRSSALASKATGFPIAKVAAKLAVGLTLDEIPNDITKVTPASFEPTLDYVVVKTPRWDLGKFPDAEPELGTQMKAVGESMAMGRTFEEALQKALKSLDIGVCGLKSKFDGSDIEEEGLNRMLSRARPDRIFYLKLALKRGYTVDMVHKLTGIDPWFIRKIGNIIDIEEDLCNNKRELTKDQLKKAKVYGFSDEHIASLTESSEEHVREARLKYGIVPTYKTVDTCAAEFESYTPYFYSTYEEEDETIKSEDEDSVMILGSGPNRIGQGIEFDYCCVQSVYALKEMGFETIMVNSNPETVSTDYDTSDKLYFEPLTGEDVLNIIDKEKPLGVIVQFGGQAPLKMAHLLENKGVKIMGTSPDAIDLTEDRKRFSELLHKFEIKQPRSGTALSFDEALSIAKNVGYPVIVRPSYVLGGRGMKIVHQESELEKYVTEAAEVSEDKPILIDEFLEDSIEIEVDAVCDGTDVLIGGIMEHIEEAGVHSGDSACVLPPQTVNKTTIDKIKKITKDLAKAIGVIGLMNIQYAVKNHDIYVLEVNPRASRTIPYVSKSTGVPLAKIATKVILGKSLNELGVDHNVKFEFVSVKNPVFSFSKLPGVNPFIGPEMKATGETMGMDSDFGRAFYKSQIFSNHILPSKGNVYISVKNKDIRIITLIASKLHHLGFDILSTENTGQSLNNMGIITQIIPDESVIDMIKSKDISLVINTNVGNGVNSHEFDIVTTAVNYEVPYYTTVAASLAVVNAIETLMLKDISVRSLQDFVTGAIP